jgi:carbon monoxide dehydrogenase subunit G
MKVEGRYTFTKSRPEVWRALQDPETLAATLPGVRRLEVVAPDEYAVTADVGIGSVKGVFDGAFSVHDKKELESCILRGSARGASGSAQVDVAVRLSDADGAGTLLEFDADARITGPIAGVGQRMVSAASKRMAQQFFEAVDRHRPVAEVPVAEPAAAGKVFERPAPARNEMRTFVAGVAVGFALTLAGVAVGRWSARRS